MFWMSQEVKITVRVHIYESGTEDVSGRIDDLGTILKGLDILGDFRDETGESIDEDVRDERLGGRVACYDER
jgi:hypothetical protein